MYYLDTNICIYFLKGMNTLLKEKLLSENPHNIKIPSIVKAELLYGAEKSLRRDENLERVNQFLFPLEIIGFGDKESVEYSFIRAELELQGNIIGPNDLVIAATVKANDGILVTHNTKEYSRVKGLNISDWTISSTSGNNFT